MVPTAGALLLVAMTTASARAQTPVEDGFRDFSYGSTVTAAVTGEKAESKLWWNDGVWWGCLFNPSANRYRIHRFDRATQSWMDTGTSLDDRRNSKADTLWDEATRQLYVVSHVFSSNAGASTSSSNWARLYRFSYSSAQQQYTLDTGFPVSITRGTAEVLTMSRDSTGRLWVTHVQSGRVKINWSGSSDLDWGTPIDLPVATTPTSVTSDDISAVVAFGGARIGVMWSNQKTRSVYFAHHWDTDAPTSGWEVETVLPNSQCPSGSCADDHVSLQADSSGRVFGVVKTSLSGGSSPLILLVVRSTSGTWSDHTVNRGTDNSTRPILVIDDQADRLHIATAAGGSIYMKTTAMNQIAFTTGRGQRIISSSLDTDINDPTSTKQTVNGTTGLLVLASDATSRRYLHSFLPLGAGSPAPDVPSAPTGLRVSAASSTSVDLAWTDTSDNEAAFHVERATGSASFAEIARLGSNAVGYQDATVSAGTAYTYRVRASNADGFSPYSNSEDITTPESGQGATVKDVTFEGGSLTHATTGVDKVAGAVSLETAAPLKGSYSARFANVSSAYLEENFSAVDDLYVSFYLQPAVIPASDARILLISNSGTTVGNLVLRSSGRVRLRYGSTSFGESAVLQAGQVYRMGIRQRRGAGGDAVLEGYLATGDAAFGTPFAFTSTGTWTTSANRLRVGATTGTIHVVVDDIRVASGAMPGPSESDGQTLPAAPADLSATAVSSGRIDLTWTDRSSDEGSFRIERRSGGSFAEIATVGANVTQYSDASVSASTTYEYRVRARNAAGDSSYSNTAVATTPAGSTAPDAPTALRATPVSSTRVDLAWTDNSNDESAFHIERATGGGTFSEIATVGADVATYTDANAKANTTYEYRVRAHNGASFSPYSDTASATTPGESSGTALKAITFEDGSLTAPGTGADRVIGAVALETAAPLAGAYSARVPNAGSAYVEESFDATDDLYLSLLVNVGAWPSGDVRLVLITSAGVTVGNLVLRPSGRLRLRVASTVIGAESVVLVPGQIYRVGVRQQAGTGADATLEAFVAPEGSAFGTPFAETRVGAWTTAADRVRTGATTSTAVEVRLDDIRLAAGAMPEP